MTLLATTVVVSLLAALAVLQALVACGAPLGRFVWGGQHEVLPIALRVGSAVSVLVYAFIALVLLDRAGTLDVFPSGFTKTAAWVITGYFALGIAMNAASRSRPERYTMTPVCLVAAACSAAIALS